MSKFALFIASLIVTAFALPIILDVMYQVLTPLVSFGALLGTF